MSESISTFTELEAFVARCVGLLCAHKDRATVVVLNGDLGAGKTTFVQTLGNQLGSTQTITSPTYTIIQTYDVIDDRFHTLIHMDAYRLDSVTELAPLRFSEVLARSETLVCIEWGAKILEALPKVDFTISLTVDAEGVRTGTILAA